MNKFASLIVFIGITISVARLSTGCALFTAQNANLALDVGEVACAIAHAESDDKTVQSVCGIADVLFPDLQKILAEQRKAVAKAKRDTAPVCDSGR